MKQQAVGPLSLRDGHRDHDLSGNCAGYRERHVQPDLLLIYRKSDTDTLRLAPTVSYSLNSLLKNVARRPAARRTARSDRDISST